MPKSFFFRKPKTDDAPLPKPPPDTRLYAIGDIHGRLDLLLQLRRAIAADAAKAPETHRYLVYLGDYIDRGMESAGVIDLLLDQPMAGFNEVFLMGNHEFVALEFLERPVENARWLSFGGAQTLASYRVKPELYTASAERLVKLRDEFIAKIPKRHVDFLSKLNSHFQIGDFLFVHAGVRPGVPLDKQKFEDLIWIREPFLSSKADHGYVVVHGHTVTDKPVLKTNRIGLDTGAYASHRLSCLIADSDGVRVIATQVAK